MMTLRAFKTINWGMFGAATGFALDAAVKGDIVFVLFNLVMIQAFSANLVRMKHL